MTISRIYQAQPIETNSSLHLDEKASHHLAHVLRAKVGEQLILFNGSGGEYRAEISQIGKKGVEVTVLSFTAREVESPVAIHLAQGMARGEKMDFIIQKAVELGVNKITPLVTARCNVRISSEQAEKRLAHWESIAQSACEQSGRNYVPVIAAPVRLKDWFANSRADLSFVLSPHVSDKFPVKDPASIRSVQVLIGPEGGLDNQEVKEAQNLGFLPLSLGPRVLRTETATIAALTALQCRYGDLT